MILPASTECQETTISREVRRQPPFPKLTRTVAGVAVMAGRCLQSPLLFEPEPRHAPCPRCPTVGPLEPSVDTLSEPPAGPETEVVQPRPARPRTSGRWTGRKQFSLLIVRGDGTRVVRFHLPRRAPRRPPHPSPPPPRSRR